MTTWEVKQYAGWKAREAKMHVENFGKNVVVWYFRDPVKAYMIGYLGVIGINTAKTIIREAL